MKDALEEFLSFWLENNVLQPPIDNFVVTFDDGVIGSILYRDKQFQVQLFTVAPNTEIVDHIHPNVDSFEVYVGGTITFRKNQELYVPNGICHIRVKPNDWHGASIGEHGGIFLSVQHWENNVPPSSVHLDWAFKNNRDTERNSQTKTA